MRLYKVHIVLPLVAVAGLAALVLAISTYQTQLAKYQRDLAEFQRQEALDEQQKHAAGIPDWLYPPSNASEEEVEKWKKWEDTHPSLWEDELEARERKERWTNARGWEVFRVWSLVFSLCSLFIGLIAYLPELLTFTAWGGRAALKSDWTRAAAFSCATALLSIAALTIAAPHYSPHLFWYNYLVVLAASAFTLSLTYNIRSGLSPRDYVLAATSALLAACLLYRWH